MKWQLIGMAAVCAAGLLAAEGKGTVSRIRVHGVGLEGNLAGDTADPEVTVYLAELREEPGAAVSGAVSAAWVHRSG